MKVSDLIRDPGTGQLSQTKLWTNIAYCTATVSFLYPIFVSKAPADNEALLIYLTIVGGHCALSKFLSLKYGGGQAVISRSSEGPEA